MKTLNRSQIAAAAIDMFLEYRDKHGYTETDARIHALLEVDAGLQAYGDTTDELPLEDWQNHV